MLRIVRPPVPREDGTTSARDEHVLPGSTPRPQCGLADSDLVRFAAAAEHLCAAPQGGAGVVPTSSCAAGTRAPGPGGSPAAGTTPLLKTRTPGASPLPRSSSPAIRRIDDASRRIADLALSYPALVEESAGFLRKLLAVTVYRVHTKKFDEWWFQAENEGGLGAKNLYSLRFQTKIPFLLFRAELLGFFVGGTGGQRYLVAGGED